MTTCLRPIFPGQTNAILAVIFHQKQHETNGKQYLNQCTHNKTTTTTLAAILTNDFLSMRAYVFAVRLARAHGTRKIYMVGVWKVFNCFGGFTWSSVNKNLWMRNCKRVLFSLSLYIYMCNNWQIKRNGKTFRCCCCRHENGTWKNTHEIRKSKGTKHAFTMMKNEQEAHDFFSSAFQIAKWHVKKHLVAY